MTKVLFAFAAATVLPLFFAASAQAPSQVDVDSLQPMSGGWSYRAVQGGSQADFTDSAAAIRLSLRCNRSARTVSIVRTGVPAAAPTLTVWTSSISRNVPARYLATRELIADLTATDPLLDAIAFSRGRFATAAAGAPMATVPDEPELSRVIEDCRG